MIPQQM